MNLSLCLYNVIDWIITYVFRIRYYLLEKISQKYLNECHRNINNIFSLLFKTFCLLIYLIGVFHLHIFFLLIRDYASMQNKLIGISFRFIVVISISCICALFMELLDNVINYLFEFIFCVFHLLLWILSLCLYIFTFDKEIKDEILFKNNIGEFSELCSSFCSVIICFFIQIYRYIIFLTHLSNIFSIIRIFEIYKNKKGVVTNELLFESFIYIFFDIFVLIPSYFLIILITPVFIFTNINILKIIFNFGRKYFIVSEKENQDDSALYLKYNNIKALILSDIQKVFIFIIGIFLSLISIIFIWRLPTSISILIQLFKTKEIKTFCDNYLDNLVFGIYPIILLLIHISPIHLKALYYCYYGNKNKNDLKEKYEYICLYVFIEKWLDIFVFLLSIFRLISLNFYLYLIRKRFKIEFLFLLVNNKNIIDKYSNKENRYKIMKIIFFDIIINLLIILQIMLGIFNPFFTVKVIKNIFIYFIISINKGEIKFYDIENKFINRSVKTILTQLFFYFLYLPISLFVHILAFWTIKYNIIMLKSVNIKAFNKIKEKDNYCIQYINNLNNERDAILYCEKNCNYLGTMFISLFNGYHLIFGFIIIHLTFFRIFIFWKIFIKLRIDNNFSFSNLIKVQLNLVLIEFIYMPVMTLIFVLEPWNCYLFIEFFKAVNCDDKFKEFIKELEIFFNDIIFVIKLLLIIITVIDIVSTILLIIRILKIKYFPTEENKLIYNLKYKTEDFKTELNNIYNKRVRKIISAFFFILNILLITRIYHLFKDSWPYFLNFLQKRKQNIINCFICKKKKKEKNNDKLSSMPCIIISKICNYLNPGEITLLSVANKKLNEKTNINYIWEKKFYEIYDKRLKNILDLDEYNKFYNITFDSYKIACKSSFYIILEKKGNNQWKIETLSDIIELETINSICNIPFMILIPRIIIYYILYYLNSIIFKLFSFLLTKFNKTSYFKIPKKFNLVTIEQVYFIEDIKQALYLIWQILGIIYFIFQIIQLPLFYLLHNINYYLFKIYDYSAYVQIYYYHIIEEIYISYDFLTIRNFLGILAIIGQIFILCYNSFLGVQIIFIKLISFNFKSEAPQIRFVKKVDRISFMVSILQIIYAFIFSVIIYIFCILPSLYYVIVDLHFKLLDTPYNIIYNISNIIYNSNIYVFIQIFLGKYCLTIPFYYFNLLNIKYCYCYLMHTTDILFVEFIEDYYNKNNFMTIYFPIYYITRFLLMNNIYI